MGLSYFGIVKMIETKPLCIYLYIKLGKHVNHDERMNPIDIGGLRSRTPSANIVIKLMNMIDSKPLSVFNQTYYKCCP